VLVHCLVINIDGSHQWLYYKHYANLDRST